MYIYRVNQPIIQTQWPGIILLTKFQDMWANAQLLLLLWTRDPSIDGQCEERSLIIWARNMKIVCSRHIAHCSSLSFCRSQRWNEIDNAISFFHSCNLRMHLLICPTRPPVAVSRQKQFTFQFPSNKTIYWSRSCVRRIIV